MKRLVFLYVAIPCVALMLPAMLLPDSAEARSVRNRDKIQDGVRAGGWQVAFGKEIPIEQTVIVGVATFYFGGPAALGVLLEEVLRDSQKALAESAREQFTGDQLKELSTFAEETIRDLLASGRVDKLVRSLGKIHVKAGICTHNRREIDDITGLTLFTENYFQPYLGVRIQKPSDTSSSGDSEDNGQGSDNDLTDSLKDIKNLSIAYYNAMIRSDKGKLLSLYHFPLVNYFGSTYSDEPDVKKDMDSYFSKWAHRTGQLRSVGHFGGFPSCRVVLMRIVYHYEFQHLSGEEFSGTSTTDLIWIKVGDEWKIAATYEKVDR